MSVIVCKKIFSFVPLYGSVFTNVAGAVVKLATAPKTPLFSRALAEKTKKKKLLEKLLLNKRKTKDCTQENPKIIL